MSVSKKVSLTCVLLTLVIDGTTLAEGPTDVDPVS